MGPYCNFCQRRCFLLRVLRDGRHLLLATCAAGMEHDRRQVGEDHQTALNPVTGTRDVEVPDYVDEAVRLLHRPDGGVAGPGAMCVECTPGFGTSDERPVAYPCAPVLALEQSLPSAPASD